ncbi:unnamed protein product [Rotaria magnacalcarata]|uniref:EF-hand domain-containing protein n=2 Tax=Rotaria magnacalcarata TaxID=392030 RepID=A0A815HHX3_9BILA|nr:unnamed protein product [Rotaria magnacalcarata]CAF1352687.1 unnamed protein product [Rotaria magnacalcarata]CAF2027657.1 unnamed protein product [Rotaria magnacalcarata]CAF2115801.1 unnamed protein product [Rotaria magnacalcarata]CAF4365245.1 unnamed protein product [Rotaria magnacalcarata]
MFGKCQIVPALATAVHGAIEELPHMHDSPSLRTSRNRLIPTTASPSSHLINTDSHSSMKPRVNSLPTYNRTTPQLDARKAFAYFDKNRDGKLTIKEFRSVMHDLGYKPVDKRFVKKMFAEANRNGNKCALSYDEFVEFLESKLSFQNPTSKDLPATALSTTTTTNHASLSDENCSLSLPKMSLDVEALFNCYDLDKNGFIEPKELRKVMKRLTGEKLSKQDIDEMISVADKNGDGLLDKSEFALLCDAF